MTGSGFSTTSYIQSKDGKPITKEDEQCERWKEHFGTVLNRPDPDEPAPAMEVKEEFAMDKGPITCQEIEKAIRDTKGNRAPGQDRITADMLKADASMSATCLVELFNKVWTEEGVPEEWQKGIIIKLPKKGDLTDCGNWRGINLLSVPGKNILQNPATKNQGQCRL